MSSSSYLNWQFEYHRIVQLMQSGDTERALHACEQLHAQYPEEGEYIANLHAILLCQNQRFSEGIAMWKRIPNWQNQVALQSNIGRTYQMMGDLSTAQSHLTQALLLDPHHLDANLNMGVTLQRLQQRKAAIAHYEKVLKINPQHDLAQFNLATVYQDELDFQAAYQHYEAILQRNPSYANALANLVFTQHYVVPYQPDLIAQRAKKLGQLFVEQNKISIETPQATQPEKHLHIGLVSADLQTHPVGFFLESLLKSKAAQQFTWTAYANSPTFDDLSVRLQAACVNWYHVNNWSDERLVQQIQSDKIDILIDLSGLTCGNRISVFAAQPAPLQINWLGYFGTTGLPTMQAVIADPYCVPVAEEGGFVERVWRMPQTRLCLNLPSEAVDVNELPALSKSYITFGCFQNLPKINDEVLSIWAQIAFRLPEARWHFQNGRLGENSSDVAKLIKKLQDFGFDLNKISFCGNMPRADYLAKYHDIDLILDTFPYCGGTTTSEALWMGVPTLTFSQTGMVARQGEQLMSAAGLSGWVCHDLTDYVRQAVYWGQSENWAMLNEIRSQMRAKVRMSPLFDAERFGRDWCDLVRVIWREHCVSDSLC